MSSLIILSIVILINNGFWVYLFKWWLQNRERSEEGRLRELTKALKSRNILEYNESLPNDTPLPIEKGDEILEINDDSVPDATILKALKRAHNDDQQDKN